GGNDNEDNEYEIKADKEQEIYNQNLNHLNDLLNKAKNLLMQSYIETLENRHTMPRTSKDFNRNTLYWD
ncbi:16780_t:CDS:2, partial [Gigaspora margarita]